MTLWFVFALMTAAAIFAVLWPLGRHGQPQQDGSEAVVYKDQLAEIDRDVPPKRKPRGSRSVAVCWRQRTTGAIRRSHRASACGVRLPSSP